MTRVVGHVREKGYAETLARTLKQIPQRYPGLEKTWRELRHAFAMAPESAAKPAGRAAGTGATKKATKKTAAKKKTATGRKKTSTRKTVAKKRTKRAA